MNLYLKDLSHCKVKTSYSADFYVSVACNATGQRTGILKNKHFSLLDRCILRKQEYKQESWHSFRN